MWRNSLGIEKKYGAYERQHERNDEDVNKRRAAFALWNLKRMKMAKVVIKAFFFLWAIVWSVTGILCFFSNGFKLLAPFALLPAVGFWVLLARSSGSITEIDQQIQEVKKTMEE